MVLKWDGANQATSTLHVHFPEFASHMAPDLARLGPDLAPAYGVTVLLRPHRLWRLGERRDMREEEIEVRIPISTQQNYVI